MMLYSKNGSIPKPQTDGTEGWIEVPDEPQAPEGKEVVWWFPPGWVIRDHKPAATDTTDWSWSQSEERWVEHVKSDVVIEGGEVVIEPSASATTTLDFGTAQPIIGV